MAAVPAASPPVLFWRRSIAWLLFLGPFFFLSYGYANRVAASAGVTNSLFFAWEREIPFVPWTILPYWSIDLLYGLSFLCCRSRGEVDRHALRLLSVQLISVGCFLLFPLRFAFERPIAEGSFAWLFDALGSFDLPFNQAPSLHIGLLVLIWVQFGRLRLAPALKFAVHFWALLIGVSVLTTWQHHFIDVPTGIAAGLFCIWLWPDNHPAPLRQPLARSPRRWRLALIYLAGAGALLFLALSLGGLFLLAAWPALALALVAMNYAWAGAAGFQKLEGRHSLAGRLVLAPYVLGAWLNSRAWTWRRPSPDMIADGVWLGRQPTATEMRRHGFAALIDLSAELPAPTGSWRYANLPCLDLVPPDADALLAAAERIEALRQTGPTLVACALGYSRSAAAVAAWLIRSGRAGSAAASVELIRQRRPQIVLGGEILEALERFTHHCLGRDHVQ